MLTLNYLQMENINQSPKTKNLLKQTSKQSLSDDKQRLTTVSAGRTSQISEADMMKMLEAFKDMKS